jgi:hypothetical protein
MTCGFVHDPAPPSVMTHEYVSAKRANLEIRATRQLNLCSRRKEGFV